MGPKRVHVARIGGDPIYNMLLDDGSNVLRFRSGHGFITRDQVQSKRWEIIPGWLDWSDRPNPLDA